MECPTARKAVVRWVPTPNTCTRAYCSRVPFFVRLLACRWSASGRLRAPASIIKAYPRASVACSRSIGLVNASTPAHTPIADPERFSVHFHMMITVASPATIDGRRRASSPPSPENHSNESREANVCRGWLAGSNQWVKHHHAVRPSAGEP